MAAVRIGSRTLRRGSQPEEPAPSASHTSSTTAAVSSPAGSPPGALISSTQRGALGADSTFTLPRSRGEALINQAPVLETQDQPLPDGSVVRTRRVRLDDAKYPDLLVEQTFSPGGNISTSKAMAAAHLLILKPPEISEADFRAQLHDAGLEVAEPVGPNGVYRVGIAGEPSIAGFRNALLVASAQPKVALYAEPDFLVNAHDLPRTEAFSNPRGPVQWFPDQASNSAVARPSHIVPVYHAATGRTTGRVSASSLPAGARTITFDQPDLWTGPGFYRPYLLDQNMAVSTNAGVYVTNAQSSAYPNNGSYYVDLSSGATGLTIKHSQGLPFQLVSIDLSEYSTTFAQPTSVTFTGYKKDGTTVAQTFVTDGIMDGTGSLADFQTFTFNASFANLDRVVVATALFAFDNIVVVVSGTENPAPPVPAAPVVYSVTFDPPDHTPGQTVAVGGHFAPTTINFGAPRVAAAFGPLTNALSFQAQPGDTDPYQQVSFYLGRLAKTYTVEFDVTGNTAMSTFLDGTLGFARLDTGGTTTSLYLSDAVGGSKTIALGSYNPQAATHFKLVSDRSAKTVAVYKDGTLLIQTADMSQGDMKSVRYSVATSTTANVGVDNVVVSAAGTVDTSQDKPTMYVARTSMDFGAQPVGSSSVLYMSVFNNGYENLQVTSVKSTSTSFVVPFNGTVTIPPAGQMTLPVTFTPGSTGAKSGTITVKGNDTALPSYSFPLTGSGTGVPTAAVSPGALSVTMLGNTAGAGTLAVANTGSGPLTWSLSNASSSSGSSTLPPVIPADPMFGQLWGLTQSATNAGGIDAVDAWNLTTGSGDVIVAVIDSGVDYTHPDLQGNLWTNPNETAGNGADDDHNGLVDDVRGWNFQANTADPMDDLGHGTHVAGTIAAAANGTGICGVAWHARIMPVKFMSSTGVGYTSDAINAIDYASRMGAKVANNSWGGSGFSQSLSDTIQTAGTRGMVCIASAGNDAKNIDTDPQYPAAYVLPNLISVASCEPDGTLSYFSNYGAASVSLVAPGDGIVSLWPGSGYATLSGTSMASPHVSGIAALVLALNPTLSVASLVQQITANTDALPALSGQVQTNGRANAYRSVSATVPAWVQVGATGGSVSANHSQTTSLTLNTSGLLPGTYAANLTVTTNDPKHSRILLPVQLTVGNSTGLLKWQMAQFGSNGMLSGDLESSQWGASATPYGDGISNLLRYAVGSDLHGLSSLGLGTARLVATEAQQYLTMSFVRRQGDGQLSLNAEGSSDLVNWSGDAAHVETLSIQDNLDGTETVTVRSPQPVGPGEQSFLRLRAGY